MQEFHQELFNDASEPLKQEIKRITGLELCEVAKDKATALEMAGPYLGEKYKTYAKWGQDEVLPGNDVLIAYPIVGGLNSVFGTLAAVIFVQAFLIEGLRDLGDWRNLLFGALIILAMNLRPQGFLGRRRA